MKERPYYFLALSLLILASGFLAVAHKTASDAQRLKAIGLERAVRQHIQAVPDQTAASKARNAQKLMHIGLAEVFGAVVSLIMAVVRKERPLYVLPIFLLLLLDMFCVMM